MGSRSPSIVVVVVLPYKPRTPGGVHKCIARYSITCETRVCARKGNDPPKCFPPSVCCPQKKEATTSTVGSRGLVLRVWGLRSKGGHRAWSYYRRSSKHGVVTANVCSMLMMTRTMMTNRRQLLHSVLHAGRARERWQQQPEPETRSPKLKNPIP